MAHLNCSLQASFSWAFVCVVKAESCTGTFLSTGPFVIPLFLLLCLGGASWQPRDWATDLEVGFSGLITIRLTSASLMSVGRRSWRVLASWRSVVRMRGLNSSLSAESGKVQWQSQTGVLRLLLSCSGNGLRCSRQQHEILVDEARVILHLCRQHGRLGPSLSCVRK